MGDNNKGDTTMSTDTRAEALINRIVKAYPEMGDRIPELIYVTYITDAYPGHYPPDPTEPINIEALNDVLDANRSDFEESYEGEYDTPSDFAMCYVDELELVPDTLSRYLDAGRFWDQELWHDYTDFEFEGRTYIFRDL